MYIKRPKWKSKNGKTYRSAWLCESFRNEDGKSQTRYVANLKGCTEEEIQAVEFGLKNAGRIHDLKPSDSLEIKQGKSIGAVWVIAQIARRLGITKALGDRRAGQLALWQVIARVVEQGSRLSAVRMHEYHALAETVGLRSGFNEDDLYANLAWLSEHQADIEKGIFQARHGDTKPTLMLYDVTSSYLEGDGNEFAMFGYNRDGKKGKKQIVIGLLCDESGIPVSVEVFHGNTLDFKTLAAQIFKITQRFQCERVTLVGDRGMIKSAQIEDIAREGFHYITALTKVQIRTLIKNEVVDIGLFDENICEIEDDGRRLILRRNPCRAAEIQATRQSKQAVLQNLLAKENERLRQRPRAQPETSLQRLDRRITKLKVGAWIKVGIKGRSLYINVDEGALTAEERLDGCYVIVTDLAAGEVDAATVHARYKDLAKVEHAFRMSKTGHLELRPIYVQNESSTRGHVFVVMLSYLIRYYLSRKWAGFDLTVEECLRSLSTLSVAELHSSKRPTVSCLPTPSDLNRRLLAAVAVHLPTVLPSRSVSVGTRKKLVSERITQ